MITEDQFIKAARDIGCDVAAIKAVNAVESRGSGFLKNGKPKILFEGHIFWKQLLKKGIDPKKLIAGNEDILYPTWTAAKVRPLYKLNQYVRLNKAISINKNAALASASWGAFQIMGFNFKACSFPTVQAFVNAQSDPYSQLQCFCNYIKHHQIDINLVQLDWSGFARAYNGPEYTQNQYDKKLQKAYEKFKSHFI